MRSASLRHPTGETHLLAGKGALNVARDLIGAWVDGRRVFVITDRRIWVHHATVLEEALGSARAKNVLEVDAGEAGKTLGSAKGIWQAMLQAGGNRDSRVLAFGGGSVGDVAGFSAGCFLRGVEYTQIPTTLLAQVDASIGGKTAVNLDAAKNCVGLFHHPRYVIADTTLLRTLPEEEMRSGLAEGIKTAVMLNADLFRLIESNLEALLVGDADLLDPFVAATAAEKIRIVEQDPGEHDERRLLNFGHTLGHALETCQRYSGLRHGEAVAYGMLFAARLAFHRGLALDALDRLRKLLSRLDLPALPPVGVEALWEVMSRDKKVRESGPVWVLPAAIGQGAICTDVDSSLVRRELGLFLSDPWS